MKVKNVAEISLEVSSSTLNSRYYFIIYIYNLKSQLGKIAMFYISTLIFEHLSACLCREQNGLKCTKECEK